MAAKHKNAVEVETVGVNYERRDLSHRVVFSFLAALGLSALLIHLIVWGLFENFGKSQFVPYQSTNPIETSNDELKEVGGDPAESFPMPRLQPDPTADLNKFRMVEEQRLNSYGWVDPKAGRIRIPIERAIDVTAATWGQQQGHAESAGAASGKTTAETKTPDAESKAGAEPKQ